MKQMKRFLSLLLVMALTAATALTLGSCDKPNVGDNSGHHSNAVSDSTPESQGTPSTDESSGSSEGSQEMPEGQKTITVTVTDDKGQDTVFTITTTAEYLRGALEQESLVEGEESEFGLYIKVVNGLRADYDLDRAYWNLLKGGAYLMTGADTTPIADGDAFELVYTKG